MTDLFISGSEIHCDQSQGMKIGAPASQKISDCWRTPIVPKQPSAADLRSTFMKLGLGSSPNDLPVPEPLTYQVSVIGGYTVMVTINVTRDERGVERPDDV